MEIRLEKSELNNFKGFGWQKRKTYTGGFEVKNFSYTYILFQRNHSKDSKIINNGINLLHKYKVEKTEVISRLLFTFLLTNHKNIWSDRIFAFSKTFS